MGSPSENKNAESPNHAQAKCGRRWSKVVKLKSQYQNVMALLLLSPDIRIKCIIGILIDKIGLIAYSRFYITVPV